MRNIILNFHGIGEAPGRIRADESPYWISRDFFQRIIELTEKNSRHAEIVFTFDDGNASDLAVAAPLLLEFGRRATFFVLAGRIGDTGYLDRGDIRQLLDLGMNIGLHGRNHVDWRTCSASTLDDEIGAARRELAAATGRGVDKVSIPFGAYNRNIIRRLIHEGFHEIHTSDGGTAQKNARIQARTSVRADFTIETIENVIKDRQRLSARCRRLASMAVRRYLV